MADKSKFFWGSALGKDWRSLGLIAVGGTLIAVGLLACQSSVVRNDGESTQGVGETPALSQDAIDAAMAAPDVVQGRRLMQDPSRDRETAAVFSRAAAAGNPVAQTYMGYFSYVGHGVPQSDVAAADWYRKAAVQGFVDAQMRLALLYAKARDLHDPTRTLKPDIPEQIYWLQAAAAQGIPLAKEELGSVAMNVAEQQGDYTKAFAYLRPFVAKGEAWAQSDMCVPYMLRPASTPEIKDEDLKEMRQACELYQQNANKTPPDSWGINLLDSDEIPANLTQ